MKINENILNKCLDNIFKNKFIFNTVFRVESGDGSFAWEGARGEMRSNNKYFIASVTKLFVTAIVMSLIEEKKINFDDKIAKYLPSHYMEKLHVLKGVDYSGEITIKHLISNTSGIPDYFFHKEQGKTLADSLFDGVDKTWSFDETIQYVKKMTPNFAPGKKGKAAYSDTNYQLLGKIFEVVTGKNISKVFKAYIFDKLYLVNTYFYKDKPDNEPTAFYFKEKKLCLPNYMASIDSEGGIVSTAKEVMIFLKEFFRGRFFPKEKIADLMKWNLLLPPPGMFYFGIGLEKFYIPGFMKLFYPINIVGFWGQTGSFAWYNSNTDLYFSGTTNQCNGSGHNAAGNAMIKIIKSVLVSDNDV